MLETPTNEFDDFALPSGPVKHLYVHIPFCHRICPYCSFYKHTPGNTDIPAFLQALIREAKTARERWPLALETVYFGGGTPTFPSPTALAKFLQDFTSALDLSNVVEWTFEANPRTFDETKIKLLLDHGVNRLSLGVQAWDQATLTTLGRDHTPEGAEESFHLLRQLKVPVVNLDLMFAIPGQSLDAWEATLRKTASLGPDSVSAYNLNYEEDTEFFEKLQAGQFANDDEQGADFFLQAAKILGEAGLEAYEVSNYARSGFESVHNRSYWRGADYLGLGPGAYSTIHGKRWKNVGDTPLYTLSAGHSSAIEREAEAITEDIWRQERLALMLRTREGIPLRWLGPQADTVVQPMIEEGLAKRDQNRLILTAEGRLVADSAALHVMNG